MAALPPPLVRFLELFNDAEFWESHEALEDAWRRTESDFYQALILYASAWVHWERGNAHGVRAQLGKALNRLEGYPSPWLGMDVEALRDACERGRRMVAARPEGWEAHLRPEPLSADPRALRGDEPELADGGVTGG